MEDSKQQQCSLSEAPGQLTVTKSKAPAPEVPMRQPIVSLVSRLPTLIPELRNKIYELCIVFSRQQLHANGYHPHKSSEDCYWRAEEERKLLRDVREPALTMVSKQIRSETLPMFYGLNDFLLDLEKDCSVSFLTRVTKMPGTGKWLRKLELELSVLEFEVGTNHEGNMLVHENCSHFPMTLQAVNGKPLFVHCDYTLPRSCCRCGCVGEDVDLPVQTMVTEARRASDPRPWKPLTPAMYALEVYNLARASEKALMKAKHEGYRWTSEFYEEIVCGGCGKGRWFLGCGD